MRALAPGTPVDPRRTVTAVTREERELANALGRCLASGAADRLAERLELLLKNPVRVIGAEVRVGGLPEEGAPLLRLAWTGAAPVHVDAAVSSGLAVGGAAAALGGMAPDGARRLTPAEEGALLVITAAVAPGARVALVPGGPADSVEHPALAETDANGSPNRPRWPRVALAVRLALGRAVEGELLVTVSVPTACARVAGPAAAVPASLHDATALLRCTVARCRLDRAALDSLRTGDVLVFGPRGEPLLGSLAAGFPCAVDAERPLAALRVTAPYRNVSGGNSTMATDPNVSFAPAAVADGELEVVVELARASLPVRDLLGLAEGSIVALDRPWGSSVELYAGGRRFARGELVDIDGEVGVRVSEIFSG